MNFLLYSKEIFKIFSKISETIVFRENARKSNAMFASILKIDRNSAFFPIL